MIRPPDDRHVRRLVSDLGDATVEPATTPGETRVSFRGPDLATVRFTRTQLLTAWIRRMTDEREVDCAMTRIEIDRQRRRVQATRAWVDKVVRRRDPSG